MVLAKLGIKTMIKPITIQRWQQAQEAERKQHKKDFEDGVHHYRIAYSHNFRYLGIDPEKQQNHIVEVGCADFTAFRYVNKGKDLTILLNQCGLSMLVDYLPRI